LGADPSGFTPVRYYNRIRNNGDALNPYIVEWASGSSVRFATHDEEHLLAIGSILFMSNAKSLIWGSGLLNKSSFVPNLKKEQFFAVRGVKTRDFLIEKGIDISGLPLGDPGIFASKLIPESKRPPTYRAAIIPHHDSIHHEFYKAAARDPNVVVTDILSDGLKVIEQIRDSEVVISESLHGLIFAESFGKPCVWISRRIGDANWDFKFQDWYSTTSAPDTKPASIKESLNTLISKAVRSGCTIDLPRLQAAFPSQVVTKPSAPLMSFRDCRSLAPVYARFQREPIALKAFGEPESAKTIAGFVNGVRENAFRGWSERAHLYMQFSALRASERQIAQCCRLLDEKLVPDFIVLTSAGTDLAAHEISADTVVARDKLPESQLDRQVIGIVLRPDFGGLSQNYLVATV